MGDVLLMLAGALVSGVTGYLVAQYRADVRDWRDENRR